MSATVKGPYHNAKSAATYCGYSVDHFKQLARKYHVPKCGPAMNRYAESILDQFMADPTRFLLEQTRQKRRQFKPIEVEI